MNSYVHLLGFDAVLLEESFVLGIRATPSELAFDVDLVLTPEHPEYVKPPASENECFRVGHIRFHAVTSLTWRDQGARSATDASGEKDFGHIDRFEWEGDTFKIEGDWGNIELVAAPPVLVFTS